MTGEQARAVTERLTGLEQLEQDVVELQRALAEVRMTGKSSDGLVVATAGGRGELVSCRLTRASTGCRTPRRWRPTFWPRWRKRSAGLRPRCASERCG